MATAELYDETANWLSCARLLGKNGGIIAVAPRKFGIATGS
jgi:glutaminase